MFELTQLEQLIAFSECETLSKTAEILLISQPALSRSMQKLESDIGVTLFDRTKNKISLNDNGHMAVEYAKQIISDSHNMIKRINDYDRSKHTINIGSCAPAPLWNLSPIVSNLYSEFTISVDVKNTQQVLDGFHTGLYQLIILPYPIKSNDLICLEYCKEHLLLSLPPAHPLSLKHEICLKDLANETMLLYSEIGFWYDMCMEEMPNTKFVVQSSRSDFNILVQSTVLPSFSSDLDNLKYSAQTNRIILPIKDECANPAFYCILRKSDKSRFSNLIDFINYQNKQQKNSDVKIHRSF